MYKVSRHHTDREKKYTNNKSKLASFESVATGMKLGCTTCYQIEMEGVNKTKHIILLPNEFTNAQQSIMSHVPIKIIKRVF